MGNISIPNSFSPNTTISSSDVNDNFSTVANVIDGNLDASNLASDAVTTAKIADSNVTTAKIADGAVTSTKLATNTITLGYAQITSNFTTTANGVLTDVPGLSSTVTIPAGGRRIRVTVGARYHSTSSTGIGINIAIIEDSTEIAESAATAHPIPGGAVPAHVVASKVPSSGSHTYKVQIFQEGAGTYTLTCSSVAPGFILVELI